MLSPPCRIPEPRSEPGDDLLAGGTEQALLVAFIRDIDSHDPVGDQGRYPASRDGTPSLATICCAHAGLLRNYVERLHLYALRRFDARRITRSPAAAEAYPTQLASAPPTAQGFR
ncbi:hypothetical protein [Streptomyces xiamenensis]|uniref:hypothetical protein n=1 Tax=Streptomyces xiamenensis TaxID=408015 RepID=UPI0035DAA3DE